MFQRKGSKPIEELPTFKVLVPKDPTAKQIIMELLVDDLKLVYIKSGLEPDYLIHRNGSVGEGQGIRNFLDAKFPEFSLTELTLWKITPFEVTMKDLESLLGHQIKIIEEKES